MKTISARIRPFRLYIGIFLGIAAGVVIYGLTNGVSWSGLKWSPCFPGCFCEEFHSGAIVQPISSYSNLGYILVGLAIIASARISTSAEKTRTNLLLRQPVYTTAFGILVIFVGLTSLFYHVSLTLVGRWLDYLGMYSIVSFAVVYNLARLRILHNRTFVLAYAVLMLCLGIPMIAISSLNVKRLLLLISILGMLALEAIIYWVRRPLHNYPGYLLSAVGILALAIGINLLDEYGKICTPNSLWQWHAVWHFLTAVVLGLLYLYFRTADDGRRNPAEI